MTASGGVRPDRPVMIPQIACLADGGCYVAGIGSQAAEALAGLPALRKAHDLGALGPSTAADVAELIATAGEQALASGWVRRADGHWLCPAHTGTCLDSEPRHFTVVECIRRHRLGHTG